MPSLFASSGGTGFKYADIILPLTLPQALTYGIPEPLQNVVQLGMRVEVALGRSKQYSGIITRLHNDTPEAYQVKPIKKILDETPIINATQLQFWQWIMYYYMAMPGEVMHAALPAHLKLSGETRLSWNEETPATIEWSDAAFLVVDALDIRKEISISELRNIVGEKNMNAVLNELLEHEAVWINDSLEPTYKPKKENIVTLHETHYGEEKLHELFKSLKRAPKQETILLAYIELAAKTKIVRQSDLLDRANANTAQLRALADKGVFIIEQKQVDRIIIPENEGIKEVNFTESQQQALDSLSTGLQEKNVVLLEGVTGSGKTLLYIHKIKEALAAGKQAVLLLPEIGLTTQLVSRLYSYFGEELGVYHSRFSNNERVEIWEKVKHQRYKVIVGPRSVLWLPYDHLGLVIVDEEHDGSYKQKDPAPRFHARDAAIYLASLHQAKVILGSATPSLESLYNARQKKYAYVALKERYQGVKMPEITIVNAKSLEQMRARQIKLITPELMQAMINALQHRKQIILFQNRRGYAPFQLCTVCGWVPQCKNCSVSLTYHKSSDKLHCHYCGTRSPVIHTCPSCGSNRLQSKSFGTERIEEEVKQIFPEARVARMDVDSMRAKHSMTQLLEQLEKQKIDILVGTQMVVKGLDFANVALVGILNADSLLSYPDFRVNERAFQLMEQVSGRAGRTDGAGKVVIQAYNVQHPVLRWVQQHDVQAFYHTEIPYRQHFAYPPFTRLIKIIFKHKDETRCIEAAGLMAEALKGFEQLVVQGPVPALVSRVRNLFIQEIWLKCPRDMKLIDAIKARAIAEKQFITSRRGLTNVQIHFDVDVA
ncbi:MAG TPA: primosomal protein N' [Flavipsychrobacter sp.]|nr:primosomal protein N' [Flavipsychrobacter sp.]